MILNDQALLMELVVGAITNFGVYAEGTYALVRLRRHNFRHPHGQTALIEAAAEGNLPDTLVIDFEEVFLIDDTGAVAIINLIEYADRYGVDVTLARVHSGTLEILRRSGAMDEIGEHRIYDTVRNAVAAAASTPGPGSQPDQRPQ
jgi:anti-anti-sigma regulatory factor